MENCPRCNSPLRKDQKSIRCSNTDCMYHLSKEEKAEFLKARAKKIRGANNSKKENLTQSERAKRYYYRKKGLQMGYLTIQEAAKLKGVTVEIILKNIHLFSVMKNPVRLKYDFVLLNCNLRNRKKKLR